MSMIDDILTAVYNKDYATINSFSNTDLNVTDKDGRTPLMHAALADDADPVMVQLLIEHNVDVNAYDNSQRWTALHFAARSQKEYIVRLLIEAGATVDCVDMFGNTPLWRCVMNSSQDLTAVKELLKFGADPYRRNNYDEAPIDVARKIGRADLVALIVDNNQGVRLVD